MSVSITLLSTSELVNLAPPAGAYGQQGRKWVNSKGPKTDRGPTPTEMVKLRSLNVFPTSFPIRPTFDFILTLLIQIKVTKIDFNNLILAST